MRTRSERAAGVDDDRGLAGRRRFPRRPDPEPACPCGAVESLPPVLPPGLDALGQRERKRGVDLRLACGVRVYGELQR
jgi:hypothetical protein